MALFGKKKKEDVDVESLGFGFPATDKKRTEDDREGITPIRKAAPPPPPEPVRAPKAPAQPMPPPEATPKAKPAQAPAPTPAPPAPRAQAPPAEKVPRQPAAKPEIEPVLEARPPAATRPEAIEGPRAPAISKLRPHVFLKISKYKEVMSSIDKIMEHIKGLKNSLKNIKEIDEKEAIKIKQSDELLAKLEEVARVFDKIFSNPEK